MKAYVKVLVVAFFLSGIIFDVVAQLQINANEVTFRDYDNPTFFTYHYGDVLLHGGDQGTSWGWLWCNRAFVETHVDIYGDAQIWGDVWVYGYKHFIHPHPTDDSKLIRYIAVESGEALTLARGTAKTVNGQVTIELPEHFSLVTSKDAPITVILTPEKAPVLLYTKQKNREKVVVAMKPSDFSEFKDVEFSFMVTGVRDGFENQEVIVAEDRLNSSTTIRADVQKRIDAFAERSKARRDLKRQQNK